LISDSEKKITSIVGDDHISLSNHKKTLELILEFLENIGFKISMLDTYISSKIMFYCEEIAMVP